MSAKESKEILEVEVLISDKVVAKHPEISEVYDAESKKIHFSLEKSLPKEFKDNLKAIMPQFSGDDIVQFNPLINAINELQQIKILIPIAGEENFEANNRVIIDNTKIIGSFNSSLAKAKKLIKEPHLDFNKKVDALFNLFETESKNAKNALEENFKDVVAERERIKKEKDDKKKQAETQKIAELTSTNTELEEKMKNESIDKIVLESENRINQIVTNVAGKLPTLNQEGMNLLLTTIKGLNENSYVSLENQTIIGIDNVKRLRDKLILQKDTAIALINSAINQLLMKEELEKRNIPVGAPVASVPSIPEPAIGEGVSTIQGPLHDTPYEPVTDKEKFQYIADFHTTVLDLLNSEVNKIAAMQFEHPDLRKIQELLCGDQYPKFIEQIGKLKAWSDKKNELITNLLK